ncbi:NAD-dependent epimerase/dehydratase family protein [Stieleria sp. TO1_6]|uniref:NAD-dependent epimerase/dehydratase family protein n=1 Tax=Stieleria tagensis TaxID=2956795 RepID=UPI00209B46A7|nr:NAD-dependent epimerase/dehydratase family protein [Stieleria tagensis]MCO8125201.1 NAD-dependent epimerase/dehydratase family protein [Stieleria tagensis]
MRVIITGSSGLIGSAAVRHWDALGAEVIGIDNDMRAEFFGPQGSTRWNQERLESETRDFRSVAIDIRDRERILDLFQNEPPNLIIHCAAQPSHDKAAEIPLLDFDVNAGGTLNLLEATRRHAPEAVFCHMSTNKVYGDAPNELPLQERQTRWDYARGEDYQGINESCRIDQTMHSLFGASKTAADVLAQEYGRYFGLKTGIFRGGCLTGAGHSGVELHGFLSYLVHVAVTGKPYTIFGYKGKQVRDQIECSDVVKAFEAFARNPRPGQVYNIGGGRQNAASVLECIEMIREISGYRVDYQLSDQNRKGDHICYISDLSKLRSDYPDWDIRVSFQEILTQMLASEQAKQDAL